MVKLPLNAQAEKLTALDAAQTPKVISKITTILILLFIIIPFIVLFLPWQQNIQARGAVTAYSPNERKQTLDAPITGVITHWYVQEGSHVKKGDIILEMSDVDPNYQARISEQRNNLKEKLGAKENELYAYEAQVNSLVSARDAKLGSAQYRLDMAKQKINSSSEQLGAAQAALDTANLQYQRLQRLFHDGLISKRDLEVAERDQIVAQRQVNTATANLNSAKAEERSASIEIQQIRADNDAYINASRATLNKIKGEIADSKNSLTSSDIVVSRQNTRLIAPRDGTIFRVPVNTQSEIVSQGQSIVILVPDTNARAVELYVDSLDAALMSPGNEVRIEFEGWPAIQFSGWPNVAFGTFGGKVAFVDAVDDGKGQFRVMIIPDNSEQTWPSPRFLRQGSAAKGWIMLNNVTIGYEIWRLLNGFPPKIMPGSDLDKSS